MSDVTLMKADAGEFSVLVPVTSNGLAVDAFPSPVIAWVIGDTGVVGVMTPSGVYPGGCAIWGPEGHVESDEGHWLDPEAYIAWLKEKQAMGVH